MHPVHRKNLNVNTLQSEVRTMTSIPQQYVEEMASAIQAWDRRRVERNMPGLMKTAAEYREKEYSPVRFRADVRRCVVSNAWLRDMTDVVPNVTDEKIDTLVRRALSKATDTRNHWMTSQPLKR